MDRRKTEISEDLKNVSGVDQVNEYLGVDKTLNRSVQTNHKMTMYK